VYKDVFSLIVSTGHAYGCVLYFMTSFDAEGNMIHCVESGTRNQINATEPHLYFYFYFVFLNALWIIIPILCILNSTANLAKLDVSGSKKKK
jgi:cholestenol delta-isomerase